jgi:hypothetical protein
MRYESDELVHSADKNNRAQMNDGIAQGETIEQYQIPVSAAVIHFEGGFARGEVVGRVILLDAPDGAHAIAFGEFANLDDAREAAALREHGLLE